MSSGNISIASVVEISTPGVGDIGISTPGVGDIGISMAGVGDISVLDVTSDDCRGSNITGWLVTAVSFCTAVIPDITSLVTKLGVGVTPSGVSVAIGARLCDRNSSENPGIV